MPPPQGAPRLGGWSAIIGVNVVEGCAHFCRARREGEERCACGVLLPARARGIGAGMLKHNTYFDGGVQSIAFERHGLRASVGVIDVGEHAFDTASAERMTVVSG